MDFENIFAEIFKIVRGLKNFWHFLVLKNGSRMIKSTKKSFLISDSLSDSTSHSELSIKKVIERKIFDESSLILHTFAFDKHYAIILTIGLEQF